MRTLQMDEFLRSLKQNIDTPHSVLLGAGASVESGVKSAADCIWEWKKEIFLSKNPGAVGNYENSKQENVRRIIQRWLDAQNSYPEENSTKEYSFYAEKALPIASDRRKFFQHLVAECHPSLGYHLLAMLAQKNIVKTVWTTNFDGLMVKCAHQYTPLSPIEITAKTADHFYRGDVNGELLCVALHGDYKYGYLKNTENELDSQDGELVKALIHELTNRDLIVIGYSGRDISLMQALSKAYRQQGSGRLFWCGYGSEAPDPVKKLIDYINDCDRDAFYISTGGFDNTLYAIARYCMGNDKEFLSKIDCIKQKLSPILPPQGMGFDQCYGQPNKAVSTNAYPITFPHQCFQFEISCKDGRSAWNYCRELYKSNIMAVPYNGMIYAWGEKETIAQVCANNLKGSIELCPLAKNFVATNGTMQELLLKTITKILAESNNLKFTKDKIWDSLDIIKYNVNRKIITAYRGIKLALLFDKNNSYITLTPSYMFADNINLSEEEKKSFADFFYSDINKDKPNKFVNQYIFAWMRKMIGSSKFETTYPINSTAPFIFKIGPRSALLGVNSSNKNIPTFSQEIMDRMIFKGKEYKDPLLKFYSPTLKKFTEDFHPMRGLLKNAPFDCAMVAGMLRQSITVGIVCPVGHEQRFSAFITGLNKISPAKHNTDFLISFKGFYDAFKIGLDLPDISSDKWENIIASRTGDIYSAAIEFGNIITKKIEQLNAKSVDVVLIYIPKEYELLTSYSDKFVKFDLHDHVKAYSAQHQIATQFIREKTIESDLHCQIMWALSLALYVKAGRIPWTIAGIQPDTAFAGIGYSVMPGSKENNIVVGCSHIYSSDGQGMKYRLSKIHDVHFDRKNNPYLSEDEAYRIGLTINDLFHSSFSDMPKRVVIHKRTPFRKDEIKGLVESLSSAGIKNIDLIEVSHENDLKCFALNYNSTDVDEFPVARGLCFPINANTMYLFTHGIAPSVINDRRKYFQGGKSIPLPLKVVRHYGNGDIVQIATEILGLSKMNWNSFNLYSKLPCTIESSNEIARIGWLLSQYDGSLYDYRYFM